jgi:hypothetical protein
MTQAFNLAQLANNLNTSGQLDATDGLFGVLPVANGGTGGLLPVANGGTGRSTLTANNVILGNGTTAVQLVAPGTSGNVLTSNGTTWASVASGGFGTGQTWQVVSRSSGVSYTNTTGKPIGLFVEGSTGFGYNGGYFTAVIDGNAFSGTWGFSSSVPASIFIIVPPGSVYSYIQNYMASWSVQELR